MDFSITDEQKAFKKSVFEFARNEIGDQQAIIDADEKDQFRFDAWKKMADFGLLGLPFPEEYSGQGTDIVTTVMAMEAFSHGAGDAGTALSWGAHTILCGVPIWLLGTEAQKKKYLPKMCSGEMIGGFALTEPGAGSDAASVKTRAEKKGNKYILNGTKMFITNGPQGHVFAVIASTDPKAKHFGVSSFIVEKDFPGFKVSKKLNKMGNRTSPTAELVFDNCEVPAENLLGTEGMGFVESAKTILEWERACLLASGLGSMEAGLEACLKYSKERHQFGRPIASFQAIQHKLANMKVAIEGCRWLVYRVAWMKQNSIPAMMEASVAKLFLSECAMRMAEEAVQIHGGYGYIKEYPVERGFRDAKLATIGGGTSEIQRLIISRMLLNLPGGGLFG